MCVLEPGGGAYRGSPVCGRGPPARPAFEGWMCVLEPGGGAYRGSPVCVRGMDCEERQGGGKVRQLGLERGGVGLGGLRVQG